jgi:Circadian oscillating protein COP23
MVSTAKAFVTLLTVFATLGLTGEFGFTQGQPASTSVATTFQCVELDQGYATIAKRGTRTTTPMITWKSTAFGPQFTPQRRCQIVSDRLTQAVAANGGKLKQLKMTYGTVNGSPTICYINSLDEKCNDTNLLLTLNRSDRGQERLILQQLVTFSIKGGGSAVSRGPVQRAIVDLGLQVESALGDGGGNDPSMIKPVTRPQQPVPSVEPAVRSGSPVDNSL